MSTRQDRNNKQHTSKLAIDVGGTWLRIYNPNTEARITLPSPSILNMPELCAEDLREILVETFIKYAPSGGCVYISLGAAMNQQNGHVYGSAPLWGNDNSEFNLLGILQKRKPDTTWRVVNDVTAGLYDIAPRARAAGARHVAYLTVSSGVAVRMADLERGIVPLDQAGLQGEVGHLPLTGGLPEAVYGACCECGLANHIASISSGPGLERVANRLGVEKGTQNISEWLTKGLLNDAPIAKSLAKIVVRPIADLLKAMWVLDPYLDQVYIGGGVAENMPFYSEFLIDEVTARLCYSDAFHTRDWVDDHLKVCGPGEVDLLQGVLNVDKYNLEVMA